jgi:hypothetical protein
MQSFVGKTHQVRLPLLHGTSGERKDRLKLFTFKVRPMPAIPCKNGHLPKFKQGVQTACRSLWKRRPVDQAKDEL